FTIALEVILSLYHLIPVPFQSKEIGKRLVWDSNPIGMRLQCLKNDLYGRLIQNMEFKHPSRVY
ncbi:MAG TPA: hypothetical protein PKK33_07090, partial [Candidatus Cloacimonadota bacterium]|nr:hypothetical protein [Candidatus Cloacimonadota bacterium]